MAPTDMNENTIEAVVIGGGQAGLAAAQHLRRAGRDVVVLDAGGEIGDSWRQRWDSLCLFTPAGFTHLPGLGFPAPRGATPTKDAMADYLRAYAEHFRLPVELGTRVEDVRRDGADLVVTAGRRRWRAACVIVATGAHRLPDVPAVAGGLDPRIGQLHSSGYLRPSQLPDGPALVVGAGNSGAEIALDLARPGPDGAVRAVYLAGRDVGHVPALGPWTYHLMQMLGRPGAAAARRGLRGRADPLGRIRLGELQASGVVRLPRITGARGGLPLTEDGQVVDVRSVVWCTGSRPDHRFLRLPVFDAEGRLVHHRGATGDPGLYVLGMPYQSSITSHLVGGVGRDARHVARHLVRHF